MRGRTVLGVPGYILNLIPNVLPYFGDSHGLSPGAFGVIPQPKDTDFPVTHRAVSPKNHPQTASLPANSGPIPGPLGIARLPCVLFTQVLAGFSSP